MHDALLGVWSHARDAAEISAGEAAIAIDVHVELARVPGPRVWRGRCKERVSAYIVRMAKVQVDSVDVLVERVGAPPAKR